MIKILLKTALILLYFSVASSAQTVQWYKTIKSQGYEEAYDIAVDHEGNAYVAGMIEYESDFGDNVILESVGSHDIFIAKYDSSGNLIWAKRAGGRGGDKVQSIVLDGQGFLYITGEFEDTCRWDTIAKMTPGIGVNNMFVARYDTAGHVQWVRNIQTNSHLHTRGYGVASDAQSNVYVSGAIQGDAFYDSTYLFSTAGNYDCMLVKFDKYGNFGWAKRMGGTDSDKSRSIISDGGTNLYVTGYFSGTADFQGTTLTGRGHTDLFLAKFDTAGTLQWVTQAGDTGFDRGWDVDININGNILVVGDQSRGLFDTNMASCQGSTDAFVATYDTAGNNLWVAAGGGPEADECKGVAHDSSGNVYIIGDYGGTAIFPPVTFTGGTFAEVFIASYTMNGTSLRWARNGKGPLNERGYGIGLDPSGNIYTCGNFNDSLHIGNTVIYGDSLLDCFVTRLSPQNICSSIAIITGTIDCFGSCNGTAMATASGQSPFSYNWSTIPVQYQQTATGLCAGNYTVSVTDSFGCSSTASITISDPLQLIVNTTSTNITCYGACDGTGNAIANGQSALTYSWNTIPVQAVQNITGLCAGNYTVIVTDSLGCTSTSTTTLTDPLQLLVSTSSTGITCNGVCDGTGNAIVTGQAPFAYSWNTVPVQTGQSATGLCAGSYVVNVTDSTGCIATASFPLTDPAAIILNANSVNTSCIGCADGSINLSPTGGTGVLQFAWSNGSSTEDIQNLLAGSYSVCVSDLSQCMVCDTFVLVDPTSGIATADDVSHFSLYPNPATDYLAIKTDGSFTSGAYIELYNAIGKLVLTAHFSGREFSLPVYDLEKGLYFMSIENILSSERKTTAIMIH